MLIVGFALFAVSAIAIGGVYAWARWDSDSTGRVKYVAPRYLVACAIGQSSEPHSSPFLSSHREDSKGSAFPWASVRECPLKQCLAGRAKG
jgi:hypothetical protein